jgi:hypothetical protein
MMRGFTRRIWCGVRTVTDPFPGCCLGKESTCDRTDGGTKEGSGGEDAQKRVLAGRPETWRGSARLNAAAAAYRSSPDRGTDRSHVRDDASSRGERTGAEYSSEETQDKECLKRELADGQTRSGCLRGGDQQGPWCGVEVDWGSKRRRWGWPGYRDSEAN